MRAHTRYGQQIGETGNRDSSTAKVVSLGIQVPSYIIWMDRPGTQQAISAGQHEAIVGIQVADGRARYLWCIKTTVSDLSPCQVHDAGVLLR